MYRLNVLVLLLVAACFCVVQSASAGCQAGASVVVSRGVVLNRAVVVRSQPVVRTEVVREVVVRDGFSDRLDRNGLDRRLVSRRQSDLLLDQNDSLERENQRLENQVRQLKVERSRGTR